MKKFVFGLFLVFSAQSFAADMYFLKGSDLYVVAGGSTSASYVTSGVTFIAAEQSLVLKGSDLYRVVGSSASYVTSGVTAFCPSHNFVLKGADLYRVVGSSASYVTSGVTACY